MNYRRLKDINERRRARGWIYVVLGGMATTAYVKRQSWLEALDRRFFRERYDAQRLLREVVEEVREERSFERVAPHVVARIEAALHSEFAGLLVREPGEANYRSLAMAPAGRALPVLPAENKLMFGIAKFLSTATQQRTADTAPGALLGTPRYMSPEQWLGQQPLPAWDLWAVAVVAYEMLTGTHPFGDKSPADWLVVGPAACFTPVSAHVPQTPQVWQELFERTFAYDPTRRPQSAETLFSELETALS